MAPRTNKNLKKKIKSVFSHEFIRKNHGDIVCSILMFFICGSMINVINNYLMK